MTQDVPHAHLTRVRSNQALPAPTGPADLGDPRYYLHNFRWVLDWVYTRYPGLLSPAEHEFATGFKSLPTASQGLLVRMIMRKGCFFRADKLSYTELGPTEDAVAPLIALGWVDAAPKLDVETLFQLFNWADLQRALAPQLAQCEAPIKRKRDALTFLSELALPALPVGDWGVANTPVYQFLHMPICERVRLMFFGNLHQNWSEFVLTELGMYQYEPVEFSEASRPFHTRAEIDAYLDLHLCRERLHNAADPLEDIVASLPALPTANPWLVRRRDKLLFQLAREYERAGELPQARELYELCTYPGSRSRLLRVLERLGEYSEAYRLAQLVENAPESEAERQHLQRLLPRVARKLGMPGASRATSTDATERVELDLPFSLPVEVAVKQHLKTVDGHVFYVENALLNGMFGLLCWDALFAPLPGAFFHPFQRSPADLYWPDFYQRREALFTRCLQRLDDYTQCRQVVLTTYREKFGRQSSFIAWGALSEQLLECAFDCIPADHLRAIFRRFLQDLKANCTGLPDLVQFWPAERRYLLVEVKGPGDRLQDNQRRWLDYFAQHNIPVAVCHVRWQQEAPGNGEHA